VIYYGEYGMLLDENGNPLNFWIHFSEDGSMLGWWKEYPLEKPPLIYGIK